MFEIVNDMWSDGWFGRLLLVSFVLVALVMPLAFYGAIKEAKQWESFKLERGCKIVGRERGHTSTGIAPIIGGNGGVGVVVTSTPSKTGWLCDDGITYWR